MVSLQREICIDFGHCCSSRTPHEGTCRALRVNSAHNLTHPWCFAKRPHFPSKVRNDKLNHPTSSAPDRLGNSEEAEPADSELRRSSCLNSLPALPEAPEVMLSHKLQSNTSSTGAQESPK